MKTLFKVVGIGAGAVGIGAGSFIVGVALGIGFGLYAASVVSVDSKGDKKHD